MTDLILENNRAKLSLLSFDNYKKLKHISVEKDLIFYSPSDISDSEKLKDYVEVAIDGFNTKTAIPFIIFDKEKQAYAGSTRFGLIN